MPRTKTQVRKKQGGKECETTVKAGIVNVNVDAKSVEGEKKLVVTAPSEIIAEMECEEQSAGDDNSEEEVVSEEDRENSEKSSSESM